MKRSIKASSQHDTSVCDYCKNNKDFEIPEDIIDALLKGDLVIFAGAGVSTEKQNIFPDTLYEDIAYKLGLDPKSINLSFSSLMSRFAKGVDGRKKLLRRIRERIEYVKSFPSLYQDATSFHKELANIFFIKDIITTNWDDFFELESGAIPFVTSKDFAFWDLNERKVFKIHGSINNVGSIIATQEDYKTCYKSLSKSLIGSKLRLLLGTRKIIFVGYSLEDEDFKKIYNFLAREMNDILPHAYWVSPNEKSVAKIANKKLTPIVTDGTFFLHKIKRELIDRKILIDDSIYDYADITLNYAEQFHVKLSEKKEFELQRNPNLFFTYCYQDGLIDAYQRCIAKRATGLYLNPGYVSWSIDHYTEIRKQSVKRRKYHDVAYVDGYIVGLISILGYYVERKFEPPPLLYIYGYWEVDKPKDFRKLVKTVYHKAAYTWAKLYLKKKISTNEGFVFHHTPFL